MNHKQTTILILCVLAAFFFSGCAAGDPQFTPQTPAGFWLGLWHGMIAVITFIIGLFDESVKIYEVANNGSLYDFGFLMGIGGSAGGGVSVNRQKEFCHREPRHRAGFSIGSVFLL
jgi:hypothetical protein